MRERGAVSFARTLNYFVHYWREGGREREREGGEREREGGRKRETVYVWVPFLIF